ncbi:MAG: PQQ-binding-like beta-propeller repeat protein, partial [Acidobacteriota bacterium]
DLWDFDVPMQPVLFTLERGGRSTPAVVVGTKQGHIFVLHRETGRPLFEVEERAVPASDVEGEKASPTQPFPKGLPVFGLREVKPEDAWGLDDAGREAAREWIGSLRSEGPFTPPSLRGSIMTPSNVGGFNWGGLSYDSERGLLVGATNRVAAVIRLFPRKAADTARAGGSRRLSLEFAPMRETPFVMTRDYLINFDTGMVPMTKPPWGTLAAVDLRTGRLAWEVPLGIMIDPAKHPEAVDWGSLNLGGPLTTAGGLTFIGATPDQFLRAFDTASGRLIWQRRLPAAAHSVPMTYDLDGKQYLVVAAGGHGKLDPSKLGDYLIAFVLTDN